MPLFRPQRGTLQESLENAVEMASIDDLAAYFDVLPYRIGVNYHCKDERTEARAFKNTYLVTLDKRAAGYLNGPFKTKKSNRH